MLNMLTYFIKKIIIIILNFKVFDTFLYTQRKTKKAIFILGNFQKHYFFKKVGNVTKLYFCSNIVL